MTASLNGILHFVRVEGLILATAYGLFLWLLLTAGRRPRAEARDRPAVGGGWPGLVRHLAPTAVAGYLIFFAVVAVFSPILGQPSVIASAAWGGAFLAFVIGVPAFVALTFLEERFRHR